MAAAIKRGTSTCLPYALEVSGQNLAFERIVDDLVAPLDFISFQVDAHVGEAGDGPHGERREPANDPQAWHQSANKRAQQEDSADDRQEFLPRGPRERSLPEREPVRDRTPHHLAKKMEARPAIPARYKSPARSPTPVSVARNRYDV